MTGARTVSSGALLLPVVAVLLLRGLVAEPLVVSSSSMQPTLRAGDVVLAGRQAPAVQDLHRGDLVVYALPDGRRALKRVAGLPGESLVFRDGVLLVDGEPVPEPYVDHERVDGYLSRIYEVPAGTVFLLGDHRGNSRDSREHGPVHASDLLGRVVVRLWPPVRPGSAQPGPQTS